MSIRATGTAGDFPAVLFNWLRLIYSQQMHERTDEQLLAAFSQGEMTAFDVLYARYRAPLFNFLLHRSGQRREEVEEVFQETWLKVIRHAARFDHALAFRAWVYQIARNCLIDRWRHLASVASIHVSNDIALDGAGSNGLFHPERRAASDDIHARWHSALAQLPAVQREVLLLKLEGDLGLDELALVTGVPREAAKSRLRYATAKMRELLKELVDESA